MTDAKHASSTPRQRHAVMVSSTYTDLHELREILLKAALGAGLFPEAMEHDSALPGADVIDSSLAKVERAAGYVLLIGHRYGQQPECSRRNPKQLSITELEYEKAVACGRAVIVFMLGEDYALPPRHVDRDKALVEKLEAFRAHAKSKDGSGSGVHRVYKVVNSREELVHAATASLRDLATHVEEQHAQTAATGESRAAASNAPIAPAPPANRRDAIPPAPPTRYAAPAYIGSHDFVGRTAELGLLDDWSAAEDQHPVLLFDAIGGCGKSMLTWHWFEQRAPTRRAWAGRFWYSFYESGASMADCCRHALAYIDQRPVSEFNKHPGQELARELVARLREKPWLVVLDGLERVLVAYHRSDAATILDEALEQPTDQIASRNPCSSAQPDDDELLRQLSASGPSKVLISSRLMPQALLNRAHQPIPGVRREPLRGLRPEDAAHLLQRCGVRGNAEAMQRYLQEHCDGHPLVIGVLAGLIVEPLPAAGDFDVWVSHASGGEKLDLGKLDLVQKRNHILKAAIAAVPEKGLELLETLALLHGGIDRTALEALSPHRPAEPDVVRAPDDPEKSRRWRSLSVEVQAKFREEYVRKRALHEESLRAHAAWANSAELRSAPQALSLTLRDLQRRGLLQLGNDAEPEFDLHPVVRAVVSSGVSKDNTERLGQRVVDHFSQRAQKPYEEAQTLKDLEPGLHVVRTLLRMSRFKEALSAWKPDLVIALMFNVLAYDEILATLKPFFPGGWMLAPVGVDADGSSFLMNDAANALGGTGLSSEATKLYSAKLRLDAARTHASSLRVGLSNLARELAKNCGPCITRRCHDLEMRVARTSDDEVELFVASLHAFEVASTLGDWSFAEALWGRVNTMGRDWPRALYRPGYCEYWRAVNLWYKGESPTESLSDAEQLARAGHARDVLTWTLELRGEWRLSEGEALGAVQAFDESLRLRRSGGRTDLDTECWLALARHQAGQLSDSRAEAERLQAVDGQGTYALARLWQAASDLDQARKHALRYYRWAWADGEPYVRRFELERACKLLAELNEPEPQLPPFDPSKRLRFDWEDEVEAAIARLEQQKAERDAKAAARNAKPS